MSVYPPPRVPMMVATQFVMDYYMLGGSIPTMGYWRDEFLVWKDGAWEVAPRREVRDHLYNVLSRVVYVSGFTKDGNPIHTAWQPNTTKINNVMDSLSSVIPISHVVEDGDFLDQVTLGNDTPPNSLSTKQEDSSKQYRTVTVTSVTSGITDRIIPLKNGLLRLSDLQVLPHTPDFFCLWKVPVEVTVDERPYITMRDGESVKVSQEFVVPEGDWDLECPSWMQFLGDVWGDDKDSVSLLQEWFGYVLSGEMRCHKALLMVGPARAGKGTIDRVLQRMVGERYCISPTLASMCEEFGLQSWVGKRLASISDARFAASGRDASTAISRLLAITGGDAVEVNRKNRDFWNGHLPTRIMVVSNEVPRLFDSSKTVSKRFLTLQLLKTWYGHEDHTLGDRLAEELDGIFRWSLGGFVRLVDQGWRFTQPESGAELADMMDELSSPVGQFVREKCVIGHLQEVKSGELYSSWSLWCGTNGHKASASNTFTRDLRAAYPEITIRQRKVDGHNDRWLVGIGLQAKMPDWAHS